MEIKIKPLLFVRYLGIYELEAKDMLSMYKTDVAPQPLLDGFYLDHSLALRASIAQQSPQSYSQALYRVQCIIIEHSDRYSIF
jgi:hypothetical protein